MSARPRPRRSSTTHSPRDPADASHRRDRGAPQATRPGGSGESGGTGRGGSRRGGSGLGGERVVGRQAVRALLRAQRRPVQRLWLAEGLAHAEIVDEIIERARASSVPVQTVPRERLDELAGTDSAQGVLARAAPLPEVDLGDLTTHATGGNPPFLVVCDGITDPHNLGALLRSAYCAGATGAVLARHRSAHITPAVTKAAAGAVEYLPLALVAGIPAALRRLVDDGVWTVGLDAGAVKPLWELPVATEPVALVLGAEGPGLSRLARARCQIVVAIPQKGEIDSLNVAAAGALAFFEVSRQRTVTMVDTPRPGG